MTRIPRTDERRLWDSLMEMARIGATPGGGVGRLALTDLDREARDLFVRWAEDAGCTVRIDRIGNIFARRSGGDESLPPVMTGSHLDTQPLGGRFDGIFGVLAGLEVVRTLNDAGIATRHPIEVVVWTDEEGARFRAGTAGSSAFTGLRSVDDMLALRDPDGKTLGAELARIGYAGNAPVGGMAVAAFFEAHIEQGPILEAEGTTIGAVQGAQGQRCFLVTVEGEEGHAGTMPMDRRRDALLGAARMVDALNAIAFRHRPMPVITVGSLRVRPDSPNTIPGAVTFTIDSRHPDDATLDRVGAEMRSTCEDIARDLDLALVMTETSHRASVSFDPDCVEAVRRAAARLGHTCRDIYSGAGHDACNMAHITPTGMIFVPCEKGISHNEKENARPEDLAAGADVLLHVLVERAGAGAASPGASTV
ncbi:MAG: Zn-dependent hydrolase [Alphaproteobacteria bacterium]|nr:MAG: Zn-dependent hydrolase [Alphaproteobacteria bacterium]